MAYQKALIFSIVLGSCLSMITADTAIIVHQDQRESKVQQVFKSKKFWGVVVAGIGLLASGGGAIWLGRQLLLAKKIDDISYELKNVIEQNEKIFKFYRIEVCHNKKIVNEFDCQPRSSIYNKYVIDDIRLFSKSDSYTIWLVLYSDLGSSPLACSKKQDVFDGIKNKYEAMFEYAINTQNIV